MIQPTTIPVNLYVDHLAPQRPVGCMDIYFQYQTPEGKKRLKAAENLAHLIQSDRVEVQGKMQECTNLTELPQRVEMTTGYNSKHGVYAIHNAVAHGKFLGYQYTLSDGIKIGFPLVCGNFEVINRNKPIDVFVVVPTTVVTYDVPTVPVNTVVSGGFVPSENNLPGYTAPVAQTDTTTHHDKVLPFFAPAFPYLVSLFGGNNNSVQNIPNVLPCSGGSNSDGVCRR